MQLPCPLPAMELRHLRYFQTVAQELNVTRAAEKLHMAQPPLSRQIRQFEEEVGVPLFDRVGRGLTPDLARQVALGQPIGDQRPAHPGRVLRPQGDALAAAVGEGSMAVMLVHRYLAET